MDSGGSDCTWAKKSFEKCLYLITRSKMNAMMSTEQVASMTEPCGVFAVAREKPRHAMPRQARRH
jgi:hypothetical protein